MTPNIERPKKAFLLKECTICKTSYGPDNFSKTKSIFYPDGYLPICNSCLKEYLIEKEFNWQAVDRLCQYADLPFVPSEFEKLHMMNGDDVFPKYAEVFQSSEYEGLGWDDYFKEFLKLKAERRIEEELPQLADNKRLKLKQKWGPNYDDEALQYLEQLYNGLLQTQNVAGALQADQALKICKTSYEIDCKIREGADFDKLLSSYDKLVKAAEFTPKNVKNASDFDSIGELVKWLERKGWRCQYYDNVTKDIVDETLKNIQSYNRRLYTNESGIGEEITRRIEALEKADKLEKQGLIDEDNLYGDDDYGDLTDYENDGYNQLINNEFEAEIDGYEERY